MTKVGGIRKIMVLWQAVFLAASPLVTAPPSNLTRLYYNGSAAKSHSTTTQYRQLRRLHVLLMNRLKLSYLGHPTTFFYKICWKEQILPRNLSNLGKASVFPYPLFSLLRSSSARMKMEIAEIY